MAMKQLLHGLQTIFHFASLTEGVGTCKQFTIYYCFLHRHILLVVKFLLLERLSIMSTSNGKGTM